MSTSYLDSSLLLVYSCGDNPSWFSDCLVSIITQSHIPDDLVIVLNSACLTSNHVSILGSFAEHFRFIYTKQFEPFSVALNYGLSYCYYDLVFRFDPDYLIINERFFIQYNFMLSNPDIDICGSFAYSFSADPQLIDLVTVPLENDMIISSLYRNPLIHPTVVFRRSKLSILNNYRNLSRSQDYDLWFKAAAHGFRFANLPQPLIKYRLPSQGNKKNLASSLVQSFILLTNIFHYKFPLWWLIFSLPMLLKPLFPFAIWRFLKKTLLRLFL